MQEKWYRYLFEFLSIFIAVVSAFALNNWNQNRRNSDAEEKILKEISRGLQLDLFDVAQNKAGHEYGIKACDIFKKLLKGDTISQKSIGIQYDILLINMSVIVNKTGYEALKAKGLEIVKNNDIRFQIIELYDYHYQTLRKMEETNDRGLVFKNYFHPINDLLAKYMVFNEDGKIAKINEPSDLKLKERNKLLSYLRDIENSRVGRIQLYDITEEKIKKLLKTIYQEMDWDTNEIKYPEPIKFNL